MNSEKRVHFRPQKVSAFKEIGVFFSNKISEKGALFKVENTDGLHVLHCSGGTGRQTNGADRGGGGEGMIHHAQFPEIIDDIRRYAKYVEYTS